MVICDDEAQFFGGKDIENKSVSLEVKAGDKKIDSKGEVTNKKETV